MKKLLRQSMCIMLAAMLLAVFPGPLFTQTAEAAPKVTAETSDQGLEYDSSKALAYAAKNWNISPYKIDCINFVRRCNAAGGLTTRSCTVKHYAEWLVEAGFADVYKLKTTKVKLKGSARYYVPVEGNEGKIAPGDAVIWVCNKCGKYWHVALVSAPDKSGKYAGYYRVYAHNGPLNNALLSKNKHSRKNCKADVTKTDLYVVHIKSVENGYVNDGKTATIKIKDSGVNMRTGAGTKYSSQGAAKQGGEYLVKAVKDNWAQLSTNGLWVCLDYVEVVNGDLLELGATEEIAAKTTANSAAADTKPATAASAAAATTTKTTKTEAKAPAFKIKTNSTDINLRKGAGTKHKVVGTVGKGKTFDIDKVSGGWGRIAGTEKWLYLEYADITSGLKAKITVDELNMRTGPGTSYKSKGYLKKGTYDVKNIKGGWYKLSNGYWISSKYAEKVISSDAAKTSDSKTSSKSSAKTYTVKTTADLNMRSGAGTKYKVVGTAAQGKSYKIDKTKSGWGRIAGTDKWICLEYVNITGGYKVKITVDELNLRTGPGTSYSSKGAAKKGTYTVKNIKGGWCKLDNGYWVKMEYTNRV